MNTPPANSQLQTVRFPSDEFPAHLSMTRTLAGELQIDPSYMGAPLVFGEKTRAEHPPVWEALQNLFRVLAAEPAS